jgi:RimJ/RimL family protein N-acetyltransferase
VQLKIGYSINFKKAKLPSKKKLIGKYSILEPININKHLKDLFNNFLLDRTKMLWIYMPVGPFKNILLLKNYLINNKLTGNPFFYAIYSKRLKSFCGLTTYLRIKPKIGTIEVGYITYAPNLQRTVEATEAMYLMMQNVFENLGYRRYEWKCDNLNKKSKKSALRLGFKFEGVFRQATIYKNRNRDTAWYSIIDKEWPNYKKKYLTYLKKSNFTEANRQRKKLNI